MRNFTVSCCSKRSENLVVSTSLAPGYSWIAGFMMATKVRVVVDHLDCFSALYPCRCEENPILYLEYLHFRPSLGGMWRNIFARIHAKRLHLVPSTGVIQYRFYKLLRESASSYVA